QAGLSWATVLKKREGYRKAFADFDPHKVSLFSEEMVEELMLDAGIIRNRLKIKSVIKNAQLFIKVQEEFGSFDKFIWGFVNHKTIKNSLKSMADAKATSKESDALSKELIKRGFKFTGSTVMYAHMQACGLVNDHLTDCFRYNQV
ncbi:MAG: DNA-3-methyladenine glycosylase I, partial [Opitutaceae bacterium]|nr:DNA-3-methyladenine glycosylase I [Cytophagales bacterium]